MKIVKITKRMLKMHPMDLLVKLEAVNMDKKESYPSHVYFSKEDSKELKKNLKKNAKNISNKTSNRLINYSVGLDWLNYGPNETLAVAIRPGYALIDYEKVK